jgi:hypothetical protein
MDNLPFDIKQIILEYMGGEYDLFLNRFKKWNGKKFYITLSIFFIFSDHLHVKNIEFEISGTKFGYTLKYIKDGIHNVGENLNFDSLNEEFKNSCHNIILQLTNYFKQVHFLSNIKLETQGYNYEIEQLKYYDKKEYNLLRLLKII